MKLKEINTLEEFLEWWPILRLSLEELNIIQKWELWRVSEETLFAAMLKAATRGKRGIFFLAMSETNEYLGYVFGHEQVMNLNIPVMHIYAEFSTNKAGGVCKFLTNSFDDEAKSRGYKMTTLCSARFGGSAFRFAEDRLKYRRVNVTFAKEL
jgi:hypothetical protein